MAGLLSLSMLAGCATGLLADSPTGEPVVITTAGSTVRVRILVTKSPSMISSPSGFRIGSPRSDKSKLISNAVKIRASSGSMVVGTSKVRGDVVAIPNDAGNSLRVNGRRYRGFLVFHPLGGSRYDVIEYLTFSEYLYGVLPKEVDATWPIESLKAQAVVSRSYALASKRARGKERFDLSSTVLDQVYGGQESEKPESNRAVDETQGYILVDSANQPVRAFFHAACGGHTDLPQYVWKTDPAQDVYEVISDKDFCADYPRHKWQLTMSLNTLRDKMRRAGFRLKTIQDISVLQKSPSGRSQTIILQTSKGEVQMAGNRFRLALGPETLRSTLLTNVQVKKRHVYFEGMGWGHGVGLCQWGARGRAEAGQTFSQILIAYYPKAKVVQL